MCKGCNEQADKFRELLGISKNKALRVADVKEAEKLLAEENVITEADVEDEVILLESETDLIERYESGGGI